MPDVRGSRTRDIAAAQRRIHGAALGYQPMRMKPVHFATSFFLALTGRAFRLELLNKASVPRAAPKTGARVTDEYVAEVLYPILIGQGRLSPGIDETNFKLLRSHLNAGFNNDGSALTPGFAPYNPFGVDYSAPSLRYVGKLSKNHGFSGSFVVRVLGTTETGQAVLASCRELMALPPPPLEQLGRPLLDDEEEVWDDEYEAQFGHPDPALIQSAAAIMAPRTAALAILLSNLARDRSVYAIRYMVIGLCLWLFTYLMLRRDEEPLLLIDALAGRNLRIRSQSRASYARALDRFAGSFDAWRNAEGQAAADDDWLAFSESTEARKVIEDHFRDLGSGSASCSRAHPPRDASISSFRLIRCAFSR
jgi:hypothetical protein